MASSGIIYDHNATGENALIVPARHAISRRFVAGDWISLAIGCFWNFNGSETVMAQANDETLDATGFNNIQSNNFYFGLKDTSTGLPRTTGAIFFGAHTWNANTSVTCLAGATNQYLAANGSSSQSHKLSVIEGLNVLPDNLGTYAFGQIDTTSKVEAISNANYCAFLGLKFYIKNRGLANQSINVSRYTAATKTSNPNLINLRAAMAGAITTTGDIPFAGAIPDCFYFYLPFFNNRIRLHSMCVERYL